MDLKGDILPTEVGDFRSHSQLITGNCSLTTVNCLAKKILLFSSMTVVIAGERSGVGKTTVTLALLSFLSQKGCRVQSFKVGPDYIDPMFHSAIAGRPCRNLDPLLTSQTYVQSCFDRHCQGADYALVEGVMGLFDGIKKEDNSTTIKDFAS